MTLHPRAGRAGDLTLALGSSVVVLLAAVVVLHSLVLLVGGVVHPATTAVALALALGWLWLSRRGLPLKSRLVAIGAFVGILLAALVVALLTTDVTWDGNAYHKVAIGFLRYGWNPVYESGEVFNASAANPIVTSLPFATWVDHYPKASWIFGASTYQVFGTIESSKMFTILVVVALGLIAFGYLEARFGTARAAALAVVLAGNPVSVAQIFSNYVDGSLGNLLLIAVVVLTAQLDPDFSPPEWWRRAQWVTVGGALILLANLKFTGLLYAGLFGIVYLGVLLLRPRVNRGSIMALLLTGVTSLVLAVGAVGASSYIRNWIVDGHPLAPLFGERTTDVLQLGDAPTVLREMGRFEAFVVANLSASGQVAPTAPKLPFTFAPDELAAFAAVDVRIAGYGVLAGGVLIVSLLLVTWAAASARRRIVRFLPMLGAPVVLLVASIALIDGSWWARYVPHLWLLPVLAVATVWTARPRRVAQVAGWLLIVVMIVNVALIGAWQVREQLRVWREPSIAAQVEAAGGCGTIYALDSFPGVIYNGVDAVPGIRVLTPREFDSLDEEDFVPVALNIGGWSHPLLIQKAPCLTP